MYNNTKKQFLIRSALSILMYINSSLGILWVWLACLLLVHPQTFHVVPELVVLPHHHFVEVAMIVHLMVHHVRHVLVDDVGGVAVDVMHSEVSLVGPMMHSMQAMYHWEPVIDSPSMCVIIAWAPLTVVMFAVMSIHPVSPAVVSIVAIVITVQMMSPPPVMRAAVAMEAIIMAAMVFEGHPHVQAGGVVGMRLTPLIHMPVHVVVAGVLDVSNEALVPVDVVLVYMAVVESIDLSGHLESVCAAMPHVHGVDVGLFVHLEHVHPAMPEVHFPAVYAMPVVMFEVAGMM
jgi:hypothetical protein